jgi:hypothetical protein
MANVDNVTSRRAVLKFLDPSGHTIQKQEQKFTFLHEL